MPSTNREREREIREAKLRHIEQQVATGVLVIRQMTASEHAARVGEREKRHAAMTPSERARGEALLRRRGRRAAFSGSGSR